MGFNIFLNKNEIGIKWALKYRGVTVDALCITI